MAEKKIYNLGRNFKGRCWLLPNGRYIITAKNEQPLNLAARPVNTLPEGVHLQKTSEGDYVPISSLRA